MIGSLDFMDYVVYLISACVIAWMCNYILRHLIPSDENVEILMYEEFMLRLPRKDQYEHRKR
jgi:hypothetical protein